MKIVELKNKLKHLFYLIISSVIFTGCYLSEKKDVVIIKSKNLDYNINIVNIPTDTISFNNSNLSFINGIYYLKNKTYSGTVYKELNGYKIKTYSTVFKGKLHGIYRSFHENGHPYEIRNYKDNISLGKQIGYWKNTGKLKFEYNYYYNKKEGIQKGWYSNGNIAYVYNYKNDKQEGFQQAWRYNGSLYRNFEVKNGIRYGLQKAKSCYQLEDEEFKNLLETNSKQSLTNKQTL
jgi:antitoxin component YwqK of YwqJK toxin-antitoxin module